MPLGWRRGWRGSWVGTVEQWGPAETSVSLFPLQGPQLQTAALAIGPLQVCAGPQLGLVPAPNRTKSRNSVGARL